mgnify:CR=1 FL=1
MASAADIKGERPPDRICAPTRVCLRITANSSSVSLSGFSRIPAQTAGLISFTLRVPLLRNAGTEATTANLSAAQAEVAAAQYDLADRYEVPPRAGWAGQFWSPIAGAEHLAAFDGSQLSSQALVMLVAVVAAGFLLLPWLGIERSFFALAASFGGLQPLVVRRRFEPRVTVSAPLLRSSFWRFASISSQRKGTPAKSASLDPFTVMIARESGEGSVA